MTGLPAALALAMISFWIDGDLFDGDFDAEIAAGHHDAVGRREDLVEVLQRLGAFDLGDDERALPERLRGRADRFEVGRALDEGLAHGVHAVGEGELEAVAVVGGEGADAKIDARQVEAFPGAKLAARHHRAMDVGAFHPLDPQLDESVIEKELVAGFDHPRERFEAHRNTASRRRRCPRWSG